MELDVSIPVLRFAYIETEIFEFDEPALVVNAVTKLLALSLQ
jgi:hypothetical protein